MNMGAKVKAKGTEVIINRLEQNKNVIRQQGGKNRMQINQMADFVQSTKSVVNSLKTGEIGGDLMEGPNYFKGICEAMRALLQSRMN